MEHLQTRKATNMHKRSLLFLEKHSMFIGYQNNKEIISQSFCFVKGRYHYTLLSYIFQLQLKRDMELLTSVPKTLRPKIF